MLFLSDDWTSSIKSSLQENEWSATSGLSLSWLDARHLDEDDDEDFEDDDDEDDDDDIEDDDEFDDDDDYYDDDDDDDLDD